MPSSASLVQSLLLFCFLAGCFSLETTHGSRKLQSNVLVYAREANYDNSGCTGTPVLTPEPNGIRAAHVIDTCYFSPRTTSKSTMFTYDSILDELTQTHFENKDCTGTATPDASFIVGNTPCTLVAGGIYQQEVVAEIHPSLLLFEASWNYNQMTPASDTTCFPAIEDSQSLGPDSPGAGASFHLIAGSCVNNPAISQSYLVGAGPTMTEFTDQNCSVGGTPYVDETCVPIPELNATVYFSGSVTAVPPVAGEVLVYARNGKYDNALCTGTPSLTPESNGIEAAHVIDRCYWNAKIATKSTMFTYDDITGVVTQTHFENKDCTGTSTIESTVTVANELCELVTGSIYRKQSVLYVPETSILFEASWNYNLLDPATETTCYPEIEDADSLGPDSPGVGVSFHLAAGSCIQNAALSSTYFVGDGPTLTEFAGADCTGESTPYVDGTCIQIPALNGTAVFIGTVPASSATSNNRVGSILALALGFVVNMVYNA